MNGRRRRLWRTAAMGAGALGAALLAAASLAATSRATGIGLEFGSQRPGTATAMKLHIHYTRPGDPSAKPSPIRRLQIDAPAGTVFNGAAVPTCKASDAEVMAQGPSACPSASRIGGGTIRVITGFGPPFDPFDSPTPVFNDGAGWLEISQTPSAPTTIAVTRLAVNGSRISGSVAASPGGPPDYQSAVSTVDLAFPGSGGYITTPPACPAGGRWVTTGTFTFADGTTQTTRGETPCGGTGSGARGRRPRIRVRIRPARVRAGRRVRIRVTLRSTDPRCISRAMVRLRGRRARRGTRRGRATIVASFRRRGRRTITASKPGCRTGRAPLAVLGRR